MSDFVERGADYINGGADNILALTDQEAKWAFRRAAQFMLRELMEPSDEMYEASMQEESTTDRLQAMLRAFAAANGIEIEG